MKEKILQYLLCVTFLAIILFFLCSILIRTITRQIIIKHMGISNMFTDILLFDIQNLQGKHDDAKNYTKIMNDVEIKWDEIYPFLESDLQIQTKHKQNINENFNIIDNKCLTMYIRNIELIKENINTYVTDFLIGYNILVDLSKCFENRIRWNYSTYAEYNGVVNIENGYLVGLIEKRDVTEIAKSTANFSTFCKKKNINLLYIQTPSKICRYDDKEISGILDFSNQNADTFLRSLKQNNIDTVDLREYIHDENLIHHELFYKTDHHWNAETGLWAARHILYILNKNYKYNIDLSILNQEKINSVLYPKWFLGSQGKKVKLKQAEPEDFKLLYPNYKTCLHYEIPNKKIFIDGDFSILYDMNQINKIDYYKMNPYMTYIYSDQPYERIENKLLNDNSHILIIHDSFGNCVIPFITMGIERVDSLDLRQFTGSVKRFIEIEKPDTIIILYSMQNICNTIDFTNHRHLFDFR